MTNYNMKTIREMVTAAFSAGEIRTMAFDLFYSLYQDFPSGMLKSQMLEAILEYAVRNGGIENLIEYVKEKNAYQYNRFSADLISPEAEVKEADMSEEDQGDTIYGDKVGGDKFEGDKIGRDKIVGNQYNYYYGSAGSTSAPTAENLPNSLSDFQKRRLQTIYDNITREQKLLEQFEAQRSSETNPRRLLGIENDIKRQKETIDKYIQEAAELGVTFSETAEGQTAESKSEPVGQKLVPKEEPTESPEDKKLLYEPQMQPWYPSEYLSANELNLDQLERFRNEVDVVIMVATKVEMAAALNMMERYPRRKTILKASIGPETYFLGKFGAFRTAVTRCGMGSTGERGSASATPDAVNNWHPKAIIMPGIAFGHNPRKQKMADVLVASSIIPYEHQRLGQERIFRAAVPPSNATLQNRFENALGWRFERPDGRFSTLHIGSVLSGGKLVDNLAFKNDLFNSFPEAIGGDMEGAGLAEAAGRNRVPWILVKGICDWGTGKSDSHQQLAAAASVSLVHHVLSQRNALNGL